MKNLIDVGKHQQDARIALLARQVVDRDYSRKRIMNEIDRQFIDISRRERELVLHRIVRKCYESVLEADHRQPVRNFKVFLQSRDSYLSPESMNSCFAVKICVFLVRCVAENLYRFTADGCLESGFYEYCMEKLVDSGIPGEVEDAETLLIHLKQAVIMLRSAGVIENASGCAVIAESLPDADHLYAFLFTAFWNRTKWDEIFPSIPGAAKELKRNRNILIDLILRKRGAFTIDTAAAEFFEMTGFGRRNDIYLVSFLDFYFFTWLRHFGLVSFRERSDSDPVQAYITPIGRSFLRKLHNA
jgi:hypothetical protein